MKFPFLSVTAFAFLFSISTQAMDVKWAEKQKQNIQTLIAKSGISQNDLGILITGGESSEIIVSDINSGKKMIPASITKLVTAAATIRAFPPGTKFKTTLWIDGKVSQGVLKGDLYLKGSGDPSFVSENMWFLVNSFLRNSIQKIEGDINVDDTLFDSIRYDSSRQKARVDRAYDAPTGAMSFNWNSVNIFVRPGEKVGDPAKFFVDPENKYIRVVGEIATVAAKSATNISIDRDTDPKNKNGDLIRISGKIASGSKEQVVFKNITQPDFWAGENLRSFLSQRGIVVSGLVKTGPVPSSAKLVAESESKPIENMLSDMNKFSNNYVAEMLTKNIAAKKKVPASMDQGMQALNDYMRVLQVPMSQYELYNPSGLTRENKMSARALWTVLKDIQSQFQYQPEFVNSLPIAGIDGTLKNRMKNTPAERWVRAKTGYLSGVISLAGYAGRSDGTVLPFVFIYNGSADENKARGLFDQILISLVD